MTFYLKILFVLILNTPLKVDKQMVLIPSNDPCQIMFIKRSASPEKIKEFSKNYELSHNTNQSDNTLKSNLILGILGENKQDEDQLKQQFEKVIGKDEKQVNLNSTHSDLIIVKSYIAWFSDSMEQKNIVARLTSSILHKNESNVLRQFIVIDLTK